LHNYASLQLRALSSLLQSTVVTQVHRNNSKQYKKFRTLPSLLRIQEKILHSRNMDC